MIHRINKDKQPYCSEINTTKRMKNIILIAIITVALSGCSSKTKTDFWPNGNKKSELKYYNGTLDGLSTWWFEDGKKQMECNYKNNVPDGKTTRYYFTGDLQSVDNYDKGLLNGKSLTYYEGGKKKAEMNYLNDTLDGLYTEWNIDGLLKIKGSYKKGLYNGKWEYWDNTGIKVGEGNYMAGAGIQKGFYPDGKLKREIHYMHNKKNGLELWFSRDGDTLKKIVYEDDHIAFE